MTTQTQAQYLLKTVYLSNEMIQQFAEDCILYKLFKKDNRWVKAGAGNAANTPAAYGMVWPVETTPNASVGSMSLASPNLIPPGGRQGTQAYANLQATTAGLLLDQILFDAANTDTSAFENVAERNMKTIFEDLNRNDSRIMWGDGNGLLGVVASISSLTITLSNTTSGRYFPLTKFFYVGQYITILTTGGATRAVNGVAVTAVDAVAGTITIADVGSAAAGDYIYNYQTFTAGDSAGIEPVGLRGIFGSTSSTLYGINPSTYSNWIPAKVVTTNTDPSEDFLEQLKAYIAIYGTSADCVVTHPLVLSKIGSLLRTYKRAVNTTDIPIGVDTAKDYQKLEGMQLVGVGTVYPDSNTPMGVDTNTFHLWMGKKDSIFVGEAKPVHWLDQSGNIFWPLPGSATVASPSKAQVVAYLAHFWQIGCYKRNAGALATNVNMLNVA